MSDAAVRRSGFSGLRVRLLLLVLLAVLPAFGLILSIGLEQRRLAVMAIQEEALRLAQLASAEHARVIEGTRQLLITLAQVPGVTRGDSAACTALLADLLRQDLRYANIGIIEPDGEVLCSALPVAAPVNLADRPYFRRALETRAFAAGEYQIGRLTGKATINFGYPVLSRTGTVQAVVFAALDLAWLQDLAAGARLPEGSTLIVLDRNATILAAFPDGAKWVGRSLAGDPVLKAVLDRGQGVVEASVLDGPLRLLAFTPLHGAPEAGYVHLSLGIPKATAFAAANRTLGRNLAALGLVAALALVAAWVGGDLFLVRRVNTLVAATRRLGAGDLSTRTGISDDKGELGQLARAFDDMAEAIARRQRELETLYALDQILAQAHRPEEIARVAAEHALPLLGFDAAAAFLLDERGQVLRLFHVRDLPPAVAAAIETLPVGAGVTGRAVQEQRPVVASMDAYPGGAIPQVAAALRQAGFRTLAATPFLAHGRVYGALTLGSRQPVEASEAMVSLLTSVGTQIGVAFSYAAERERMAAQDRLAALGRLAAGVAHELKNPVWVIAGRIELLRMQLAEGKTPGSERLSRDLASLAEAAARMRRIMDGLSIYSKPPKPQPQLLPMAELLAATQELVAFQAKKNSVTVSVDAPADLPPVRGDRSQLMQVLLNLATNAIEAMAEAGGQLTLRARVESGDSGDRVRVEIADTGPGIPPDALAKIWEPFYTTKAEGTGLGLSIVRSLVAEQPGAAIEVDTHPGHGTTFVLTFPTASPAEPQ